MKEEKNYHSEVFIYGKIIPIIHINSIKSYRFINSDKKINSFNKNSFAKFSEF